jgi:hypothetical protein
MHIGQGKVTFNVNLVVSHSQFELANGFVYYLDRKHCCATIKSLFTNEGKHGGEATVEAVRLIADHVKANNCQLHPDFVEVKVFF